MGDRSGARALLDLAVVVLAVGLQFAAYLYMTDANFRYRVDVAAARARHWRAREAWRARVRRLPSWAQEAVEQIHGKG